VLTQPGDEVILSTRQGMAIRFDEADVRAMGRDTRGVKGIALAEGDEVVGLVVADPQGYLLTVCEKGYGKRTPFGANVAGLEAAEEAEEGAAGEGVETEAAEEPAGEAAEGETAATRSAMRYRKQRRGGKGLRDIRTSDRNGPVVAVAAVRDEDEIMVITQQGMATRMRVQEIRVIGRNTQGVRLINLLEGDKVVTVAKIAREEAGASDPSDAPLDAGEPARGEPPQDNRTDGTTDGPTDGPSETAGG